jgi:hypothetical protein
VWGGCLKIRTNSVATILTVFASIALPQQAMSQTPLPWQTGQQQSPSPQPQDNSLHSINGVPLFIDGAQTKAKPATLSLNLLDQARNVTTLGDALKILGPAYVASDDNLHIAHWNFQDGTMLTLWPQGGEALNDSVSISPRPDCGVAPNDCNDLVLNRKAGGAKQQHKRGGGNGSSGGSSPMSLISPLMKMMPGR